MLQSGGDSCKDWNTGNFSLNYLHCVQWMSYDHTGGACSQQKNTDTQWIQNVPGEEENTRYLVERKTCPGNFLRVFLLFKTKTCSLIKERRKTSVNLLHLNGSFVMKLVMKTWRLLDSSTKEILANKPFKGRVSNPGTKIMTCSANPVGPSKHIAFTLSVKAICAQSFSKLWEWCCTWRCWHIWR